MDSKDKDCLEEQPKSPANQTKTSFENDSDLDNSDNNLEIDLNQPLTSCKSPNPVPGNCEQDIIKTIEHEIGKQLMEKAEKNNLTVTNVKTIIKQVLTNEYVRALLEKGEVDGGTSTIPYEPKLTRAKAKQLISSNTQLPSVNIPWVPLPPPSETHVLIGEDLKEDDSGDEYVPCEEESEDDKDESFLSESDMGSLPPPTPPTPVSVEDHATQTSSYTDDGIFKIPPPKTTLEEGVDEIANIALRTRSKINLSSTPLEVIEKSFIPPDITTDMYDMECDDEEWRDFLKGFTEPLEEVTKPTEDEEHDPEYNILADDEINQVDNEDFRVDKAVKISKKEVKELWEELFEYLHNISDEYEDKNNTTQDTLNNTTEEQPSCSIISQDLNNSQISEKGDSNVSLNETVINEGETDKNNFQVTTPKKKNGATKKALLKTNDFPEITIEPQQLCILEQQMRQHVQMLTQNFLLTYEHPEFHHLSAKFREYLLNLRLIGSETSFTNTKTINLKPALKLIDYWIEMFMSNSEEVLKTKAHVEGELKKSVSYKMSGNWTYVVTFPKLLLETISKSDVFSFPSLLPKIPFKSEQFSGPRSGFTNAEDCLLVFGLDMFKKFLLDEKKSKTTLKEYVACVQETMMPHRTTESILRHIYQSKHPRCATNPVQQYMLHGILRPVMHYMNALNLPPNKRSSQELPEHWKNFIYPVAINSNVTPQVTPQTVQIIPYQVVVPSPQFVINSPYLAVPLTSHLILTNSKKPRRRPKKTAVNIIKPKTLVDNRFNANDNRILNLTKADSKSIELVEEITGNNVDTPALRNPKRINKINLKTSLVDRLNDNRIVNLTNVDPKSIDLGEKITVNNVYKPALKKSNLNRSTTIDIFISIFLQPIAVQKLVRFFTNIDINEVSKNTSSNRILANIRHCEQSIMLPNMPSLTTPLKEQDSLQDNTAVSSTTADSMVSAEVSIEEITRSNLSPEHRKPETITSSTANQESKGEKCTKNLEFSTITSSSFQQANNSSEVEFCRDSRDIQICRTSQSDDQAKATSSGYVTQKRESEKDDPEDINAFLVASSTVKPNVRKELSGAEKKKNKLRKDFLANLSIATPEDPDIEKHKNEMFALAYYDKLRETLELEDYHQIMQILNDFESGDVIDLYKSIQPILYPKYKELAEEFLFFLKEKEAAAVGQLIPWLEVQTRSKFLRKLEIYFKDQPAQLRKIYNCLMELVQSKNLSMEKIKSILLPMLKGNTILIDLFLQNFRDERPPPSLLEGPYETIDINKDLARPDNEEKYETFIVPNTEDKYGGPNCICHCHKIEDNEYKSRYKHCKSCGLKFANGKPLLQSGRSLKPATVTFELNPNANHNARLLGKSATVSSAHKKKRSDTSPSKQVNTSGKENLDEDTEDEDLGKRKKSALQKTPRKRKKIDQSRSQDGSKPSSPKKSPARNHDITDIPKDNIKPRKRTYSGKRSKKEDTKKIDSEIDKIEETEVTDEKVLDEDVEIIVEIDECYNEITEEQDKSMVDDCMDSSGESIEKPLTPGQQTAESESDIYLEESSQDNYASDDSSSSMESAKGSQSDTNTSDEPAWKREEDTIILETLQKEDDKEYALQVISDKLPNRTVSQIRSRLSRLMDLLIETLKHT